MSSGGCAALDGHLCRYGNAAYGILRSYSVIRGIQRSQIQADLGLVEERLWCTAGRADC